MSNESSSEDVYSEMNILGSRSNPNSNSDAEDLIDIEVSSKKKQNKNPNIQIRMEEPKIFQIPQFLDTDSDNRYIVTSYKFKSSGSDNSDTDSNSDKVRTERENMVRNKMANMGLLDSDGSDEPYNRSDNDNLGASDEESNDLIDLSPGESVARITNQLISEKDDDIERMHRYRNIIINQSKQNTKYINKTGKKRMRYPYGHLKLVFGSMYSGKSSQLKTDRNDWFSIKGMRILVINYNKDKRYTDEDMVMTHNKEGVKCISVEHLAEITNGDCYDSNGNVVLPEDYDLILIDEGQFYDDLRDNIIHWVDILKKTVFVYGLDGDFRRQQFGQILDLIPLCDEIVKKKANCIMCGNGTEALFTWKLENNDDSAVTIDVGAEDKYVALCRKHYNRLNRPKVVITGQIYTK